MWDSVALARFQASVAQIHNQYGETVYIRRITNPDMNATYQETLLRTEQVYRLVGIVHLNPSPRLLSRYGRTAPADVIVTFSEKLLSDAGLPNGPVDGDILVYQGIRYTVNNIQQGPKAPTPTFQTSTVDQTAAQLEIPCFGLVQVYPNLAATSEIAVTGPQMLTVTASTASGNERFINFSTDLPMVLNGNPLYRFRVTVNGILVGIASIALLDSTHGQLTMTGNLDFTKPIRLSYNSAQQNPVLDGITLASNTQAELQPVSNVLVTVS